MLEYPNNTQKTGGDLVCIPKDCIFIAEISPYSGQNLIKTYFYKKKTDMKKYICTACEWVYDPAVGDPDGGIAPGTPFEDIPEDWVCPVCGLGKDAFEEVSE